MLPTKLTLCCLLLGLPALLLASEPDSKTKARVIHNTEVKAKPEFQADALGTLDAETEVAVQDRAGGWYQIQATPLGGWVPLLSVRFEASAYRPGKMGVSALWSSVTTGHSDVTVTTGVRGLGEEEIRQASVNLEALSEIQKGAVTPEVAKMFARQASLESRQVQYEESEDD